MRGLYTGGWANDRRAQAVKDRNLGDIEKLLKKMEEMGLDGALGGRVTCHGRARTRCYRAARHGG